MQNVFSRVSNPALRQGLIFGLLFGFAQIVIGFFITLGLIILVALYFVVALFAGRRASQQTGSLKAGLLAGFWTGLFAALIISVLYVIFYFINPDNLRNYYQIVYHLHYTNAEAIQMAIISQFIFIVVAVLISLGGGALGGFIGKKRAAPPADTYQESMFEPPKTTRSE